MAGIPVPPLGACNLVMEADVEQLFVHNTSKSEGVVDLPPEAGHLG